MDEIQNLNSGIEPFIPLTPNLNPIEAEVMSSPLGDGSIAIAKNIQTKYQPSSVDLSKPMIGTSSSDSLWNTNVNTQPSFNVWESNVELAYTKLNNGTYIPKFENYIHGTDNEDRLAQQQGIWEKSLNGVGKFVAKTGLNVLDATVGTVNGIFQAIETGTFNAIYNNDFSKWIDDVNTKVDYKLPNLYTAQEREFGVGSLFTTNFWADKVLGGMSFVAGTVISEAIWASATGGASLLTSEARIAAGALRNTNRAMHSLTSLMSAYQRTVPATRALKAFNNARFIYTSAGYEAGVEARHYLKEADANFRSYYANTYGRNPTGEEIREFKENSTTASNALFAANVALVGGSNIAQFGNIFGVGSFGATKGLQRGFNRALGIGTQRVVNAGEEIFTALKPTRWQKALGIGYNVLKNPIREGVIEEGGQFAASNFAQQWLASKYDANAVQDNFSTINAVGEALKETYGTSKGLEDVAIGAVIGFVSGGATGALSRNSSFAQGIGATQFQSDVARQGKFAEYQTANSNYNFIAKFGAAAAQKSAQEKLNAQGIDVVEANQQLNLAAFSKFHVDNQMGLLDNSAADFKAAISELSDEEFAQQTNISVEEAKTEKERAITTYENMLGDYKDAQNYSERLIPEGLTIQGIENESSFIPAADAQSALALNIYIGRNSDRLARTYAESISEMIGDGGVNSALAIENTLQAKEIAKTKDVKRLSREIANVDRSLNSYNEELIKLAARPRTEAGDSKLEQFETRRQQLLTAIENDTQRRTELQAELTGIAEQVNKARKARRIANQNFTTVFDEENVTADDLIASTAALQGLNDTLDVWSNNGQQDAASEIKYMLGQYVAAQQSFLNANSAYNALTNPAYQKAEIKNIFGGFLRKAKQAGADISDYQKAQQDLFNILATQYNQLKSVTDILKETEAAPTNPLTEEQPADSLPPINYQTSTAREEIQKEFANRRQEILNNKPIDTVSTFSSPQTGEMYTDQAGTERVWGEDFEADKIYEIAQTFGLITNAATIAGTTAVAERMQNGEEVLFTNPAAIELAQNNPLYNTEIQQDGSVKVLGVLNPNTNEWIGVAPLLENEEAINQANELAQLEREEQEAIAAIEQVQPEVNYASRSEQLQQVVDSILEGRKDIASISTPMKAPTQAQMDEYKKLYERNRRSVNGLRPKDQARYDELREIFNTYGRAVGTVEGGIKLADILEQIANLQNLPTQTPQLNDTNTAEVQARLTQVGSKRDYLNKTQYWEKSEFRVLEDGTYSITGINLQGFVDVVAKDNNVTVIRDRQKGKRNNRKQITTPLTGESYNVGDRFIIQLSPETEVTVTIGETKGLEINPASAQIINEQTRFKLIPSTQLGTNYQPLLVELNRNAQITPVEVANSNFELEPGLSFTDITNLEDDSEMSLQISLRSPFNQNLLSRYRNNEITLNELQSQLLIYVMSQNGEVGGVLKGLPARISEDSNYTNLLNLRSVAAQRALASNLENEIIDTQITVPLDRGSSYFGKPNFNLIYDKSTNTLSTEMLNISDKALDKIVDLGYISNGRFTLNQNDKQDSKIDTTFVREIARDSQVPVIVFNYNGSRVAYPVSMITTNEDLVTPFEEILNAPLPQVEKVNRLNQYLAEQGIDGDNISSSFYYVAGDTNLTDEEYVNQIRERLRSQTTYNDFTTWTEGNLETAKQLLQLQAQINIDITDKPFHSPKLALKLNEYTVIGATQSPSINMIETTEQINTSEEIAENTCE